MSAAEVQVRRADAREPAIGALIAALDDLQIGLYPPESNHLEPVDELAKDHYVLLAAMCDEAVVGCGAVRLDSAGYGELKRMYVDPAHRGKGIASILLAALEAELQERAIPLARLETGPLQPVALRFYRARGYLERGPFGNYVADPNSVFMEKRLEAEA